MESIDELNGELGSGRDAHDVRSVSALHAGHETGDRACSQGRGLLFRTDPRARGTETRRARAARSRSPRPPGAGALPGARARVKADTSEPLSDERPRHQSTQDLTLVRTRCNTPSTMVAERRAAGFRLDTDLLEGLRVVRERDGILPSEQVRRAVRKWLEGKGVLAPRTERNQQAEDDGA